MENYYAYKEQMCVLKETAAVYTISSVMHGVNCQMWGHLLCFLFGRIANTCESCFCMCSLYSKMPNTWLSLQCVDLYMVTSTEGETGSLCEPEQHRKGVRGARSRGRMCFSFLGKWAMLLDIPGSVQVTPRASGTRELPRSAKDTAQREPRLKHRAQK